MSRPSPQDVADARAGAEEALSLLASIDAPHARKHEVWIRVLLAATAPIEPGGDLALALLNTYCGAHRAAAEAGLSDPDDAPVAHILAGLRAVLAQLTALGLGETRDALGSLELKVQDPLGSIDIDAHVTKCEFDRVLYAEDGQAVENATRDVIHAVVDEIVGFSTPVLAAMAERVRVAEVRLTGALVDLRVWEKRANDVHMVVSHIQRDGESVPDVVRRLLSERDAAEVKLARVEAVNEDELWRLWLDEKHKSSVAKAKAVIALIRSRLAPTDPDTAAETPTAKASGAEAPTGGTT